MSVDLKIDPVTAAVGLAVVGGIVWFSFVGVRGLARTASKAAVDAGAGVVEGSVVGIGEAVGIPATDESECDRALREGRLWDASFACSAGRFIGGVFGGDAPDQDQKLIEQAATHPGAAAYP